MALLDLLLVGLLKKVGPNEDDQNLHVIAEVLAGNEIASSAAMVDCVFEELDLPGTFKAGKSALIRAAIKKAGELACETAKVALEDGEVHGGLADQLGSVLERALNKQGKEKDVAHVDLDGELAKCGLDEFFLVDTWPPDMAVS